MKDKYTIVIAGSSGFIGSHLKAYLSGQGHNVRVLVRDNTDNIAQDAYLWSPESMYLDPAALRGADVVIVLNGAGIMDQAWTKARKKILKQSRVVIYRCLARCMEEHDISIPHLIGTSAIGYYGFDDQAVFEEGDEPKKQDFVSKLCHEWEATIQVASQYFEKHSILRLGLVLGADGGFLTEARKGYKLHTGSYFGNGKQIMSWIHMQDVLRMYEMLVVQQLSAGIYNAVSPNALSARSFSEVMAKNLWGRSYVLIPIPKIILNAIFGARAALLYESQHVIPKHATAQHFNFTYPLLADALQSLID